MEYFLIEAIKDWGVYFFNFCLNLFLSLQLCAGICSATTPFILLGDVLDCLPLDQCDKIFTFVEENVSTWKSVNKNKISPSRDLFSHEIKNIIEIILFLSLLPEQLLHCWEKLPVKNV